MALAIPAFLRLEYGTEVRSNQLIGKGGFGTIMLGEMLVKRDQTESMVVMKKLEETQNDKIVGIFFNEVSIMNILRGQKNIAKIIGYTESPYFLVMKYYRYGSLDKWLQTNQVSKLIVLSFLHDTAVGLQALHQRGIAHRDIKPANVLVDPDPVNNSLFCVQTDFGISQAFNETSLLVDAFKLARINGASISYAGPEVFLNLRQKIRTLDSKTMPLSDVYSLSIVVFDMICGASATGKQWTSSLKS